MDSHLRGSNEVYDCEQLTLTKKRPEPCGVRAESWLFAGGTCCGGGDERERRGPAAELLQEAAYFAGRLPVHS